MKNSKDLYGVKPRESSVFCTGTMNVARDYGYIYAIFPIGDYTYWWSPKVEDLAETYREYDLVFSAIESQLSSGDSEALPEYKEKLRKSVRRLLAENEYKNTDLTTAIKSKNEIMLKCDSYYSVELSLAEGLRYYL